MRFSGSIPRLAACAWIFVVSGVHAQSELLSEVTGKVTIIESKLFGTGPKNDASGVVVSAEPAGAALQEKVRRIAEARRSARPETVDIAQRKKRFDPAVISITRGEPAAFVNYDRFFHNVFSVSGANRFDIGHKKGGSDGPSRDIVTFNTPGKVDLFCNIHQQMFALLYVMETPFHAVTDENGGFSLKGLPRGEYRIRFQLEGTDDLEKPVVLGGKPETVDATINQAKKTNARIKDHLRKDGTTYPATADDLY